MLIPELVANDVDMSKEGQAAFALLRLPIIAQLHRLQLLALDQNRALQGSRFRMSAPLAPQDQCCSCIRA